MDLDDALAELVAHSGDRLLRVAYQLTHDRAAAQDLVQDALLRVCRSTRRRGLPPGDWYDDRTFVLAAQRYWHIGHGQAGMPAQNRDYNTTPVAFFRMTFDPATHTAKLARLAVPETISSGQLAGMTVSPDGTRLALDLRRPIPSIQVVTLATGAIRSWAWQGGGWVGNRKGSARSSPGPRTGRRWSSSSGTAATPKPRTSGCSTPPRRAPAWRPPRSSSPSRTQAR